MIQDVRHIHAAIGFSGSAILCVGGALAILCTMNAVQAGAPYPISFAAGFCTLACSAGFCAALVAILNVTGTVPPITEKPQPNYAAWKLAGKLRVSDASRLWCNIEPGCAASQDSLAWAQAMLNAIKAGELPVIRSAGRKPGCDRSGTQQPELGHRDRSARAKSMGAFARTLAKIPDRLTRRRSALKSAPFVRMREPSFLQQDL